MGMTRQRQRDISLMEYAPAPVTGVVAEQNLEHACGQSLHGLAQVTIILKRWPADVLNTYHCDGIVATMDERMLVHQQPPAYLGLQIAQHGLVLLYVVLTLVSAILSVVVIAHDGINTISSHNLLQGMLKRYDFLSRHVDQVTGEHHEVGMLFIDDSYKFVNEAAVA